MAVLRTFILRDGDIAERAGSWVRTQAPAGSVVTISEPTRGSAINAALHAAIGEIAATREWCGKQWPLEVWKRLLVAAWSRANGVQLTLLPALDGAGVDIVQRHTSSMTQREVSDLISFIECWAAETAAQQTEQA
jgi:hypothetical protein